MVEVVLSPASVSDHGAQVLTQTQCNQESLFLTLLVKERLRLQLDRLLFLPSGEFSLHESS